MQNKYIFATYTDSSTHIESGEYKFKEVNSFTYLGSEINSENSVTPEVRKRKTLANRCFYGLRKFQKSDNVKRDTKLLIYRSLIISVLTYASETWTLSQGYETALAAFERKILRSIFGGVSDKGVRRRRTNSELYRPYREPDILRIGEYKLEIGEYKFEKVISFTYLGSEINSENSMIPEVRKRITAANRCFYGLRKFLKSDNI